LTRIVNHALGNIKAMHFGEVLRDMPGQPSRAATDLNTGLPLNPVGAPAPQQPFPIAAASLVEICIRPGRRPAAFSSGLRNHAEKRVLLAPGLPLLVRIGSATLDVPRKRGLHPDPPRLEE